MRAQHGDRARQALHPQPDRVCAEHLHRCAERVLQPTGRRDHREGSPGGDRPIVLQRLSQVVGNPHLPLAFANRPGGGHGKAVGDRHPLCRLTDPTRSAVVDREFFAAPAVALRLRADESSKSAAPRGGCRRRRRLGDVADNCERSQGAAAQQHPPLHRRQFLCLVDDDMAVGPAAVGGCAFRRRAAGGLLGESVGEIPSIHDSPDAHILDRPLGILDIALALLLLLASLRGIDDVEMAEQFGGLIEKWHIGNGEGGVAVTSQQRAPLRRPTRRDLGEPLRARIQVAQQLVGSERQPRRIKGDPHIVGTAQVFAQHRVIGLVDRIALGTQLLGPLTSQLRQSGLDESHPGLVVGLASLGRPVHGTSDGQRIEGERVATDIQIDRMLRHPLTGGHRARDELRHRVRALQRGHIRGIIRRRIDSRVELTETREHHAGLPERRQYLLDVVQEGTRRSDDEHTRIAQPIAVRVEQVGRPMQRDSSLTRAGATLHDQHSPQIGADDAVLFGLDRRHDVVHAPSALGGESREQGALPLQLGTAIGEQARVEDVILDAHDRATL